MSRALDARGLRCPWPVLRLAAAMREAGDVTITADDPAAPDEIAAAAAARGWYVEPVGAGRLRVRQLRR